MKLTISHMLLSLALGTSMASAQTDPPGERPAMGAISDSAFADCIQKLTGQAQTKGISPDIINRTISKV